MRRHALAALVLLTACKTEPGTKAPVDTGEPAIPPTWCEGATAQQWDPIAGVEVELFPDGLFEVADPSTPTGVRLDPDRVAWPSVVPPLLTEAVLAVSELSGFGTMGGGLLRFHAPVTGLPTTAPESETNPGWQLVDLDTSPPTRVPFEAELLDDAHSVRLWPLRPLRQGARHALLVTTDAVAADGGCIAPAAATQALLYGENTDPVLADAAPRYREALDTLGIGAGDVSALSVFTVHADVDVVQELAAQEALEPVSWTSAPDCAPRGDLIECTLTMIVRDRRNAMGLVDPEVEPVEAEIPMTIWLPDSPGPHPVVVYGHGLGSERDEGYRIAREQGDVPYALIAMEAVAHGDHPSAMASGQADSAMDFLGIALSPPSIRAGALRGNFDQTVLDRLRLIRLLREQPDLDGDGTPELDAERIGYLGISLGAILGPELLALDGELEGAVLSVGGARLMAIVTDAGILGDFEDLIAALVGSSENFDRLVTVAQHIVDPVDPGTWAAHVLRDRYDDAPAPHVLLQVGMYDDIVPPTAGHALARALEIPHLEPVAVEVPLLEVVDGEPLIGNGQNGETVALFQFDQVTRNGSVGPAYHVATPSSDEGKLQLQTFLETWATDGTPVILDPYRVLAEDGR
jgi:hypothetical protein